ncbi:MAG: hypothetical protein MUP22_02200 [Desulfobacterales bacterium]|nr:hypothetical protein [Desulfobacterales bacterium]
MAFDPEKDKVLKKWECAETGLLISINRYGEGEAKLQIGPRVFKRKDGGERQGKAGRLTIEDVIWFYDIIDDVKDELTRLVNPE